MRGFGAHAMRLRRARLALGSGPAAYAFTNSEAAAFVARMAVPPSNTYKAAIDKLWTRLKVGAVNGSNISTAFDIFYLRALHTSQAALLNMMGATFTATLSTPAPPFHPGYGFTTNGTSTYVEWGGWRPSDGVRFAQDSASMGVWARSPDASFTGTQPDVGTITGNVFVCGRNSSGNLAFRINDATTSAAGTVATGDGFYVAVRPDAANKRAFRNGVQVGVDIAVASALRSAVVVREGNAFATFAQDQLPFSFAGRALTAAEVADLYAALNEYLVAIGWQALWVLPANEAAIRAAATTLPAYTSRVSLPDAVPTIVAGKGFTCTGACLDPRDGTWWITAFGRNVQGDTTTNFQPYIVHVDTDRATSLGTIDLAALGLLTSNTNNGNGVQGLAFDTSDNTLWVMQASGVVTHIAASTSSPAALGGFTVAGGSNGLGYDTLRDRLVVTGSGNNGLRYFTKAGVADNSFTLSAAVAGNFIDQISYMADLDGWLVSGGPNGSDGIVSVLYMSGQNYGALRQSGAYIAPGMTTVEAVVRNPTTKVMTGFNDWWYHGTSGALSNGTARVQLPF